MPIIGRLEKDERTLAKNTVYQVIGAGGVLIYVQVTFPELRVAENIINVQFDTNPYTTLESAVAFDKDFSENVVGMSIYVNATVGTTLSVEAIALGF